MKAIITTLDDSSCSLCKCCSLSSQLHHLPVRAVIATTDIKYIVHDLMLPTFTLDTSERTGPHATNPSSIQ